MEISILAIGKMGNSYEQKIIDDYLKRIALWKIKISEYEAKKTNEIKDAESNLLISNCINSHIVALDENGKDYTSIQFAKLLEELQNKSINKLAFLIGGASGHGNLVKEKAHLKISLGKMTLPHKLARVILVEQIYRAYTIISNHPYHK